MHTGGAAGLRARAGKFPGNLADIGGCKIGMVYGDRAVEQPDHDVSAPAGAFHQGSNFNQL
jgi:hypothetical protein